MKISAGGPGSMALKLEAESTAAFVEASQAEDPDVVAIKFAEGLEKAADAELAAAYTYLQRLIGLIAVLLPPTLIVGHALLGDTGLHGSISAYYYTRMGNVFVGSLFALAVFFLSYHYKPLETFELDNWLSRLASAATVGVAILPTASNAVMAEGSAKVVSTIHLACAGALFVLLGVFAFFRFTLTGGSGTVTPAKLRRNRLYRVCGVLIFSSIALVVVSNIVHSPPEWHALLWLETVCVEAFGVSWLVKGGFLGILADEAAPEPS